MRILRRLVVHICAFPNRLGRLGNAAFRFSESFVRWFVGDVSTCIFRRFPEGFSMQLDASQKTSRQLLLLPQYELWVSKFVRKYLQPGDLFVDIGAHQGYFSLLASSLVGAQGQVLAFEAADDNAKILRQNVEQNDASSIEVVQCALGEREGSAVLYRNPKNEGGHSLVERPGLPQEHVHISTLDIELAKRNLTKPAVIKIDAEGYEAQIIAGARRTLSRNDKQAVIVELSINRGLIVRELQALNFTGYFFGRNGLETLEDEPKKGNALFLRGYDKIVL